MRLIQNTIFIFIFLLTGCRDDSINNTAKKQVENFRYMYIHDDFKNIYKHSSEKMKHSVSQNEFVEFMVSTKTEMGLLKKTQLVNSNLITYVIGEPSVVLTYSSEYSKKHAKETFTFVSEDGVVKLFGYSYTAPN